ncbi:MAG: alkaline phosphatase family protein, partial [Rhodospirillales bacterium]|nr:alkaline phosphatase family protein [Rhodospirillales bacterium]
MRRAVVLILDGLRRDFVTPELMPHLASFRAGASWFEAHRSVFPSVTRCVSACFATGCLPARHGLQANTMVLQEPHGQVLHDAGEPGFLDHRRRVTGRSLDV